ncbi:MAG: CDGSH-type Zn-finger protein, partial [Ilumatobacter sp.]
MPEAIIADNAPIAADLIAGEEYHWCACGGSANQPFCDGSHAGTNFTPTAFTAEADGDAYLCACKRTGNAPFCDGSHAQITAVQVGTTGSATAEATPDAESPAEPGAAPVARPTPEEPTVAFIHALAKDGLTKFGHHGPMTSMGVPRKDLPHWDDIQIMAAQMATKPLLDDVAVGTELVIGPDADRPLRLDIPLFVSDMSFGALSEEAKIALAQGAELAGTGICSGEGGMLPEEQQANSRYFYELASAQFGYREELLTNIQAFH